MSNQSNSPPTESFVQLATVLQGAIPLAEKGINDSFRGQLVLRDETIRPAIIKDLNPKELANELMVAALANAIGLPVPKAHLAIAPSGTISAKKGPAMANGAKLVFGSADAQTPPVAQLYHGQAPAAIARIRQRLANWKTIGRLYGFDSWVANTDRHERNLLFSGDKEVWLIDHGHCFTGPDWSPAELDPEGDFANKLKSWLTPVMSDDRRTVVAAEAADVSTSAMQLDLKKIGELNYLLRVLKGGDFNALVSFLTQRCAHVPRLSAAALDLVV